MISTKVVKIDSLIPEIEKIRMCANTLRSGGLVAFPTETVYGLGANLLNKRAVERLYKVKRRSRDKPFTIHIAQTEKVEEFARDISTNAYKLIDKLWPGPLTIILKSRKNNGAVGLRMPKNLIALNLLEATAVPVVVPSANISGDKPPKTTKEVLNSLNGLIDIVMDGGEVELGVESTIADLTREDYRIIREGAIKKDKIEKIVKTKNILFVCTGNSCRSVMAEGLFKKMMRSRSDVEIFSAGIGTLGGLKPSQETVELLKKEDIDISYCFSRPLTDEMIKKSDLILVMGNLHKDYILQRVPNSENRVYLLKEFAKLDNMNLDITDPIGGSVELYGEVFYIIKSALERIKDLV